MKTDIYRVLNLKHVRTIDVANDDAVYKTIKQYLDDATLGVLFSCRTRTSSFPADIIIYCDDNALLKEEDLEQNESAAYLCNAIYGFLGLIYGPIVVECKSQEAKNRMSRWIERMDQGYLEEWRQEELGDSVLKELWSSDTYEIDHPLGDKYKKRVQAVFTDAVVAKLDDQEKPKKQKRTDSKKRDRTEAKDDKTE